MYIIVGTHKKTKEFSVFTNEDSFSTRYKLSTQLQDARLYSTRELAQLSVNYIETLGVWNCEIKTIQEIAKLALDLETKTDNRISN